LTDGNSQASTHAASSAQVAAGYNSLVTPSGAGAAPTATTLASTGALASMGGLSASAVPATTMAATQPAMSMEQVWVPAAAATTGAQQAVLASATKPNPNPTPSPQPNPSPTPSTPGQRQLDPLDLTTVTNPQNKNLTPNPAKWPVGETAARGYISTALTTMGITDTNQRNTWTTDLLHGMFGESSYNPGIANSQTSNPKDPGPMLYDGYRLNNARGILQNIPTTFAANHQAGTSNNIYDPVANICSSMWYVHNTYGVSWDGSNLASKVQAFRPGASDPGY
jgi:hypothetical protein